MSQTVAQQLYVAYFGRPADFFGIRNFAAEVQRLLPTATDIRDLATAIQNKNADVLALVNSFGASQESLDLYGTGNTAAFVNAVYLNVLDRAADLPGLTFWVGQLDAGNITRASFSAVLMAAAINNTQSAADQNTVANKIAVAQAFTTAIDTNAEIQAYAGNAAAAAARAILNDVDSTTPPAGFQARVEGTLATLVTNNASTGTPGATITLTSQPDTTNGRATANNDTIVASGTALQFSDDIDGLGGVDTLRLTITNDDYTATEVSNGSKNVEFSTRNVEILSVTARTNLIQNPTAGAPGAGNPDRADAANTGNQVNGVNAVNGMTFDSATVDTIITMTNTGTVPGATVGAPNVRDGVRNIQSLSSEVNGSSLTFNDIQQIGGLRIDIEDTSSAHNFLFDDEATSTTATNNAVTLGLTEARALTINFGETPAAGAITLPPSTPFSNASGPTDFAAQANAGSILVGQANGQYGLVAASQSDINTLNIDSAIRGPSGVRTVLRNEVLDLNVGAQLRTLNITGGAQLKVGLAQGDEQTANTINTNVKVGVQIANPDNSGVAYSYGVTPATTTFAPVDLTPLRDFALTRAAYSLDAGIRTVNAGTHYAGVVQTDAVRAALPNADLTLDLSNGATDATDTTAFTYVGSQGEDQVNFGVRTINKDIRLGAGNDTVVGGRGTDVIRGEAGNDVIKHNNAKNDVVATGVAVTTPEPNAGVSNAGFTAGNAVTVFGGAGNDQVVVAGQTAVNVTNLVDLGTGNDTLYVDDSLDANGVANLRLAGGAGSDQIVITTAGNRQTVAGVTDSTFDNIIFADVAPGVGVGDTDEHTLASLAVPVARDVRGANQVTTDRVVNANFIADSYFATAQAGSTTDSDSVVHNKVGDNYVNLGNGNNNYVHASFAGNGTPGVGAEPTVIAGASTDVVDSGDGLDSIAIYTNGTKQVSSRGGNDNIVLKGTGNVTVLAGEGNDSVIVNSASTASTANAPVNYIDLGNGDDTLLINSAGVVNGVTEIYGRAGRDVISILNADIAVNTNHTLYIEGGTAGDAIELRARDLKGDDTIDAGNDGSIDQLILRNFANTTVGVAASDTQRVTGIELVDLRDGGITFEVTQNLILGVDTTARVGDVTSYVYNGSAQIAADGAQQDGGGNATNTTDDDGLFAAGVLGNQSFNARGVLTITTVEYGQQDANAVVTPNNAAAAQTIDLRGLATLFGNPTALTNDANRTSFVNFLGGTARDIVVVNEPTANSFSNLRFDELAFNATQQAVLIDEDNATNDTLRLVSSSNASEQVELTFGDYRNMQGLDIVEFDSTGTAGAVTFRLEASKFLLNQTTRDLTTAATNDGRLIVLLDEGDTLQVFNNSNGLITATNPAGAANQAVVGGAIASSDDAAVNVTLSALTAADFTTQTGLQLVGTQEAFVLTF